MLRTIPPSRVSAWTAVVHAVSRYVRAGTGRLGDRRSVPAAGDVDSSKDDRYAAYGLEAAQTIGDRRE